MSARTWTWALTLSVLVAACGGSAASRQTHIAAATATAKQRAVRATPSRPGQERALVTAETENRLLVVALPSGRVLGRIALPRDPEDIATGSRSVVVVSATAGKVTLLAGGTRRVLGGFEAPHIVSISRNHAYVTDDTRGMLTAIDLVRRRVTSRIEVGAGAHHLSFDPTHGRAWVALGESARTIVILNTADPSYPRMIGRFDPGFPVHDLAFSSDGRRIWLTSASSPDVVVLDPPDRKTRFRVPVGPPPQHVALVGRYAYLTSGYGGTIEEVDARTGRIITRASSPYGSFELAADNRYVVVSSLLRGKLAIYTPQLKLVRMVHLAPATREVALSLPAGSPP
jgi:DNA-binding beta-propeller fold protein YncE